MMQFVIFDTEYASWDGFLTDTPENKKKAEIVQIAALKIRAEDLEVVEEFNVYVKPYFRPKLTQYFINLTGITDELLAKSGIGFLDAYQKFKDFVGESICFSHGWNLPQEHLTDGQVMLDNLSLWGKNDKHHPNFQNIAPWFQQQYQLHNFNIKSQCSGEIAQLLGCEHQLQNLSVDKHNALYDVYSILAGLKKLGFHPGK